MLLMAAGEGSVAAGEGSVWFRDVEGFHGSRMALRTMGLPAPGLRDREIMPSLTSEPATSVLRATLPASEDRAGLGRSRFTAYVSRSR